ncbi:ABC transporter substrate-binding protein [Myceligenerans xiligouense]|uniref:NitT/TauT family transport system substrate-binding protein n=1 Tax=Myceligenerans xiligouense TaxID=253184 RepID=A0A3N4YSJ4_9MICO|nr:ABC transporter substrate-binding protein [Myceligenerans xiligouense]RPF21530.1 NitT/TauT family transport system substrate-binding protein [Myceligenerans xiligouense]
MPPTRFLAPAAVIASTLLLAACTAGSPSGGTTASEPADGELTPVTVGLLTIAPSAAVQYGIDEGIFAEHGLDVSVQAAQGGAAMLPAVSTGQIDFGVGNPLSVLTAAGQGVDMRIVSGYSSSLADGDDINAVVTRAGDGLTTWQDLAGKKVAVNTVNGQGDLTIMGAVQDDGGDPEAVEFLEVAFPDALAQLDGGNVDAVWVPEPFLSAAVADPAAYSVLGYPNQDVLPGLPTMVTFTSGSLADEDPELVAAWREAVGDVLDTATADREGFATTIAEFTGMPGDVAASLRLERLSADVDPQVLTDLSTLATEFGFVESAPDLDTIIVD